MAEESTLKDVSETIADPEKHDVYVPPFFTVTVEAEGNYKLDTNIGDSWQWVVLKLAASIKKELDL